MRVLSWLAGLTSNDFKAAVSYVEYAQGAFSVPENATQEERDANRAAKRKYVIDKLKEVLPRLAEFALSLLVENAVAYFKKQ